jgi:hypothetical protein
MALLTYRCPCGYRFEGLSPDIIAHGDQCPRCQQIATPKFSAVPFAVKDHLAEYQPKDQAEYAFDRDNQRFIHQNAEKILDGRLELKLPKSLPRELRPKVPAHLTKKWF